MTGWESRAVEFFRTLGRTRHGLDPVIGWPADSYDPAGARTLQHAERLVGLLTGTPAGGFADVRSAAGAAATGTAFDEFHHFADVRRGEGALGWYAVYGHVLATTLALAAVWHVARRPAEASGATLTGK